MRLETAEDIARLGELDQKLWVALACPVRGLEFDARTLQLMDTDGDGRIRATEVIAAAAWTAGILNDGNSLTQGAGELPLAAINDQTEEGKRCWRRRGRF